MPTILYTKKTDIERNMRQLDNGALVAELIPGVMDGIETSKYRLASGKSYDFDTLADVALSLFFIGGKGTIHANGQQFDVTERAVFCPKLESGSFSIDVSEEMELLFFAQKMSEDDFAHYEMYHIVTPWFNTASRWHLYTEGFRNEALKSYACLHQYYVSRMSLGEVVGPGNAKLEPHKHPELYQWFYGLPGTDPFLFDANGEAVDVEEGDFICIPNETPHIVSPKKNDDFVDYVWFEVVVPGLEMCPYFY